MRLSALPGEVMVRNPVWSKTLADFRDDFSRWLALSDEAGVMNLAIFYDAEAVAGDADLLRAAKQALIDAMRGERVRLARFARAAEAFPTPIGFFNNLVTSKAEGDALDLKKGGIFPTVHGVRALRWRKASLRPARRRASPGFPNWERSNPRSRAS